MVQLGLEGRGRHAHRRRSLDRRDPHPGHAGRKRSAAPGHRPQAHRRACRGISTSAASASAKTAQEASAFSPTGTANFHEVMKFAHFYDGSSHQFDAGAPDADFLEAMRIAADFARHSASAPKPSPPTPPPPKARSPTCKNPPPSNKPPPSRAPCARLRHRRSAHRAHPHRRREEDRADAEPARSGQSCRR